MNTAGRILVGLLAVEHGYILIVEMFLWDTAFGRKRFGLTPEFSRATRSLAANQGLYNGFLAAGLIWSLLITDPVWARHLMLYCTVCILIAGLYGGATAMRSILVVQAAPAAITLAVLLGS